MARRFLLLSFGIATIWVTPAAAETQFQAGNFVRQTHHWDTEKKIMVVGAAEGEAGGCWQVLGVTSQGVEMKLISGYTKPWWSEEPIVIGTTDTWFDSDVYREANPGDPPLTEISATFSEVPSCN